MASLALHALLALSVSSVPVLAAPASTNSSACRCFPGDACWPSTQVWQGLNQTVGGRLVATVPLAAPCHDSVFSTYDNATCANLQAEWLEPETHYVNSASVMAPYFANQSCDPFLPRSAQCVIGTYTQYAINVTSADDVAAGIKFATEHNIRLVVRNTGHDYNGKSTGAGALGLWLHHLKDISIFDYQGPSYTGKAIKVGAGVQGFEAYAAVDAQGLQVVGGECPTVGIAGGYTQGGGHSALASKHGLAADQTLEWELVTGEGEHLIANRQQNSDLYWALSGGGGGTYGVVLSMTSKAHPDSPTSGMNLTFASTNISQDAYYEAISTFHASLPAMVDAGIMIVWYFTNASFAISPITAPDISVADLKGYLSPLETKLNELNIPFTSYYQQFDGYLDQFNALQGAIQVGIAQYGGRLIPRSVVENNNSALTDAYRFINNNGGQFIGVGVNVSPAVAGNPDNAVNPAWRNTLIDTVITTPWSFTAPLSEMEANQEKMTNVLIPALEALTPNGSCYLNEGDFRQPNFQDVFYGENYDRLLAIKNRYDPNHMFYATTAVGSDYWEVQADKRLCRAQ
ncbi:FAD-binding domain-containing protein 12 [Elsinoe australis]|uniref:FAD-binding domain-containing protein 12 n=1 Tax=Elsinoe australis TaxID=40998 RepID=A0A4U7B497_9PEZI|nr:FAD-binding domain-containing protein 12 [Elsinoe australis]